MRETESQPDTLAQALDAFMDATGRSPEAIAREIDGTGRNPRKKPLSRATVYTYRKGVRPMPPWFIGAMDVLFSGWRETKSPESGRQTSTTAMEGSYIVRRREMPLVPAINDPAMKDALDSASSDNPWKGGTLRVPDLFNSKLPVQPIRTTDDSPLFSPGDVVLLDVHVEESLDHLFLVFADSDFRYAALQLVNDAAAWVLYDGTVIPYGQAMREAAVVVHLPQYAASSPDAGTFNALGLSTKTQILWPRPR